MLALTDKQTDLIRALIGEGFGLCRPIIPAVHVEPAQRIMLWGLADKGALKPIKSTYNGTVFVPTQPAFDLVRRLKEAEERKRQAEMDKLAGRLLLRALFEEGRQVRCVREDGWRAGVRTLDRYRHDVTSCSLFRPGRFVAVDTVEKPIRPLLLWWMQGFAPLRKWQVV